jgi:hypothetical protein
VAQKTVYLAEHLKELNRILTENRRCWPTAEDWNAAFGAKAKIGSTLRIRLPADFKFKDRNVLLEQRSLPIRHADGTVEHIPLIDKPAEPAAAAAKMTYSEARDRYGKLTKEQRSAVLDGVSQRTSMQVGPEAEAAFVTAVEAVEAAAAASQHHFCVGHWRPWPSDSAVF